MKKSKLSPFLLVLVTALLIVPLFGNWYIDIPIFALFVLVAYLKRERLNSEGMKG